MAFDRMETSRPVNPEWIADRSRALDRETKSLPGE